MKKIFGYIETSSKALFVSKPLKPKSGGGLVVFGEVKYLVIIIHLISYIDALILLFWLHRSRVIKTNIHRSI